MPALQMKTRQIIALLPALAGAALGYWNGHSPAWAWIASMMIFAGLGFGLHAFPALPTRFYMPVMALSWLALTAWVSRLSGPAMGWRDFRHLGDLPAGAWLALAAAWPPVFALIAVGSRWRDTQWHVVPMAGAALAVGLAAHWLPIGAPGLFVGLAFFLFMLCIGLYAESDRSSLTWLLFWLLLFAGLLSGLAFKTSLDIDRQQRHELIKTLAAQPGSVLKAPPPYYARRWPADSLGARRDEGLAMPLGQLAESIDGRRALSWQRLSENEWLIVGRFTGGYRPPLALFSLLFLAGLLLALTLQGLAWLLRINPNWVAIPAFGYSTGPSLRLRIQLAFLGLTLAAFLLIGAFTIRFFQHADESVAEWLEQLLTVYVFLLLVAAAIGIALANGITQPIVEIGDHLRATQLLQNQPIQWPRQDEIGRLVDSYNDMIRQLEDSARRLAAAEREEAWRKMAQQVAHEIKNPLMPMKLHIQQLQRLQQEDPQRALVWADRVAPALIEQIDTLARIAGEFSHFAQLPAASPSRFDLGELLRSVARLHTRNAEQVEVTTDVPEGDYPVHADRDHIQRVITNLLRNAVQAAAGRPQAQVRVGLTPAAKGRLRLIITDNGPGVPPELHDKIFQPHFTTKSSGAGLGLAMCRQMVHQAGGDIGFSSAAGAGTTFWVELAATT